MKNKNFISGFHFTDWCR